MRTTNPIKRSVLHVMLVSAIFLLASCNGNQKPADTKEVAEEHNEAKFDDKAGENAAQFLVNAAEINLEHIQLGQLAQLKGSVAHVKELGKSIEVAHNKLVAELSTLAAAKSITVPASTTEDTQEAFKALNEKSGNDFDKAYADRMVSEYKDAIAAFEKVSTESTDTEIKNWATATLPDLRKQLDLALVCQAICEKK